jgi:predicted nucleic acid-binding protein
VLTIDASVFVAADAADEEAHGSARAFMASALASGAAIHQPSMTVVEVTSAIARRTGDPVHARRVGVEVLHLPGVVVHELDVDSALDAAGLASDLRLRASDAVYAATALTNDSTLVTLDSELLSRAAPVIKVCTPADWLARQGE